MAISYSGWATLSHRRTRNPRLWMERMTRGPQAVPRQQPCTHRWRVLEAEARNLVEPRLQVVLKFIFQILLQIGNHLNIVAVGSGSPSSRSKKTKGGEGSDSYSAGEEAQPPGSSKAKSRSHSRKSLSKAKEADAAINSASAHSIGSMQSSISSVNPQHASHSSPQHGKAGAGGSMSEQAARLGLYA